MEVFVSDKESNRQYISSCKIGNFNGKEIEGEFCEIKSLEQHDKELLREFADKLKDKIINENTNEQGNLDYNVDLTGLLDDINQLLKERGME